MYFDAQIRFLIRFSHSDKSNLFDFVINLRQLLNMDPSLALRINDLDRQGRLIDDDQYQSGRTQAFKC